MNQFSEATGPWDEISEEACLNEKDQMIRARQKANYDRAAGRLSLKENFNAFPDLYNFSQPEKPKSD